MERTVEHYMDKGSYVELQRVDTEKCCMALSTLLPDEFSEFSVIRFLGSRRTSRISTPTACGISRCTRGYFVAHGLFL